MEKHGVSIHLSVPKVAVFSSWNRGKAQYQQAGSGDPRAELTMPLIKDHPRPLVLADSCQMDHRQPRQAVVIYTQKTLWKDSPHMVADSSTRAPQKPS
jgi:hypothetical protein